MKVLFIVPRLETFLSTPPLPSGLLSIASYIKENSSHEVKIFDRNLDSADIKKIILEYAPDIVGISLVSSLGLSDARKISQICKSLNLTVVWGGQFATSAAHLIIEEDYVDIVSLGIGEKTWLDLMNAIVATSICLDNVSGILYKRDNTVIKNEENLKDCAFSSVKCDYSLLDVPSYFSEYYDGIASKMLWIFGKKGCYGQCTFCCNKTFNHQRIQKRPYENVCSEIKFLVSRYGADAFYFGDELWCVSSEEMKRQCDMLASLNEKFVWGCTLRVDILKPEDYKYMYDHGCRWIYFGIESGYAQRIKEVKKGVPLDMVYPALKACYDSGILPTTSFILGYPNETVEELKATAKFIYDLSFIANLDIYFYAPYMGSEMYENMVKDNLIPEIESIDDLFGGFYSKPNPRLLSKYSNIPYKDLKVIQSCAIIWNTFNRDKSVTGEERRRETIFDKKQNGVLKETFLKLIGVFKYMSENYTSSSSRLLFTMMIGFIKKYTGALFFSMFFVKTRKKYDLKIFPPKG